MAAIAVSSASEYGEPMRETPMPWTGSVAIANIGLGGRAIMGMKWQRHRNKLLKQFKDMLSYGNVCGLCLGEVGNFDQPLTEEVRARVRDLVEEAFKESSASEHGMHHCVATGQAPWRDPHSVARRHACQLAGPAEWHP